MSDYTNPTTGTKFVFDEAGELLWMEKRCCHCSEYFPVHPEAQLTHLCPACDYVFECEAEYQWFINRVPSFWPYGGTR